MPACELTMASAASSDEIVRSDEKVCDDLWNAARGGKLDDVTRLLPLAEEKGVVNKVMHGVNTHRDKKRGREARTTVPVTMSCSSHLMCVRVRFQNGNVSQHCGELLAMATTRLFHSC